MKGTGTRRGYPTLIGEITLGVLLSQIQVQFLVSQARLQHELLNYFWKSSKTPSTQSKVKPFGSILVVF